MTDPKNVVWAEKYRPKTIAETILPQHLKNTFQRFVTDGHVPNLLLTGGAGIGKTTVAKAMLEEIGADYIVINGSNEGRSIDVLRTTIMRFASTVSFSGGRKYVILDEADYMNANSTQPALRNFIEEFSGNCGFIMTCNFKNRIIEPLHSRCAVVEFKISKEDAPKIAMQFMKRASTILEAEGVEFDPKVLAAFVKDYFPDWRRCLGELQFYSASGKIDEGILTKRGNVAVMEELFGYLKGKDFSNMRKWVARNVDMDATSLYRSIYDELPNKVKSTEGVAGCILVLAEYQYKEAFVADTEINRTAALASLMAEAEWS